jgi:hypothetical protein
MFAPKPISHDSVPGALAKAERYRLLNEPGEAESICQDILAIEPDNQQALISLILAQTDQLPATPRVFIEALAASDRLQSPYDRVYYAGIAWERRAKARYYAGGVAALDSVYEWILRALSLFKDAEELRPAGNDDALLRWNACVRFLAAHKDLVPRAEEALEPIISE